jgi:hypothetical protein
MPFSSHNEPTVTRILSFHTQSSLSSSSSSSFNATTVVGATMAARWNHKAGRPQQYPFGQPMMLGAAVAAAAAAVAYGNDEDDDNESFNFSWSHSNTVQCCGIAGVVSDPKKKYDARYEKNN